MDKYRLINYLYLIMKRIDNYTKPVVFLILILVSSVSCVPMKQLQYFTDINEMPEPSVNPKVEKLIAPFDKLYIKVYSIDTKTSQLFSSSESILPGSASSIMGYLVDETGDISFPFAGKINVKGLTLNQAAVKIEAALNVYVSNATVTAKFIDNNVTVMGEVNRQGTFSFSQNKINIYEALALGGGMTKYGNRKNVVLIRQEGDRIMHHRLDLSSTLISGKDYYYILPNDVIIVEPIRAISSSYGSNTLSLVLSTVTTLISVILFIKLY
jgi:polysaccharide export outer membrane protein